MQSHVHAATDRALHNDVVQTLAVLEKAGIMTRHLALWFGYCCGSCIVVLLQIDADLALWYCDESSNDLALLRMSQCVSVTNLAMRYNRVTDSAMHMTVTLSGWQPVMQ
jgi:hypothetical protein